jgi:pimeloyl-ACP methyl ester carboxylesterase
MWSDQSRRIRSGAAEIYYETYGDGPPLLIVPGLAEVSFHYFQNIPHLVQAGYRVVVMNLRGHFLSPAPDRYCHPRYFADDIQAILDAEQIERIVLLCESAGGWGGLRFSARAPERVAGLLLMGSPAGVYSDQNFELVMRAVNGIGALIASGAGRPLKLDEPGSSMRFLSRQLSLLSSNDGGPFPCSYAYLCTMIDKSSWLMPEELAGYSVPTLIVGGDEDGFLTPGFQRHVAELIPGAVLSDFQDSGHEPYWEQPERFNRVVCDWLAQLGWS